MKTWLVIGYYEDHGEERSYETQIERRSIGEVKAWLYGWASLHGVTLTAYQIIKWEG